MTTRLPERRTRISPAERETVKRLSEQGMSLTKIAARLGRAVSSVSEIMRHDGAGSSTTERAPWGDAMPAPLRPWPEDMPRYPDASAIELAGDGATRGRNGVVHWNVIGSRGGIGEAGRY